MTPEENAFHVATNAIETMVNQDERPFTAKERAELNQALAHLRKHVSQLSMTANLTLGAATLAGFLMGVIFVRIML